MSILSLARVLLLLLGVALLPACLAQQGAAPLEELTVQLSWTHGAQFAGFYAADQQGYYAQEGLKVNLVPRPERYADLLAPVSQGTAQFGVAPAAQFLIGRSQGLPIKAIAVIFQRQPLVFITLADSGIARPQDMPGHTMPRQSLGGAIIFQAMMARLGLDPQAVEQVDVGFDLTPFLNGEVDIWTGYLTDQVLTVRELGYAVNLIIPEEYGVHFYADTLITTDQMIEDHPQLVLRFLRATLRGWQWALENPEQSGPLARQYEQTLDPARLAAQVTASQPLIYAGEHPVGWMEPEQWREMSTTLEEQGLLPRPFDVNQAYSMDFLQRVYGGVQ